MWFYNSFEIKQIEGLEFLNTSEVKDMSWMFNDCSGLTSLDMSHFNTQNVTDMGAMFNGCSGLTSLDVSNFNTQNVTYMQFMFSGCSALTTINSNTAWQCPTSVNMFAGCEQLKGAVPYDENKTNFTMANPETGYSPLTHRSRKRALRCRQCAAYLYAARQARARSMETFACRSVCGERKEDGQNHDTIPKDFLSSCAVHRCAGKAPRYKLVAWRSLLSRRRDGRWGRCVGACLARLPVGEQKCGRRKSCGAR